LTIFEVFAEASFLLLHREHYRLPACRRIWSALVFHRYSWFTNNDNTHGSHGIYSATANYLFVMSVFTNKF